ncbi:armadillo-type protein [Pisolithus sp. B1]|nr:armadillo-type protein [Pisolithus sp. B1]
MEDALAKIRPHTRSPIAHQKTPADLLQALESTFKDKGTDRTPTAYFAALITTLEETIRTKETSLGDGDVLPAELYLLGLVSPFVPHAVTQTHLNALLSLTAPLFPSLNAHAPSLRSQMSLYNAIFCSLDRSQLDVPNIRQSFATVLQLCVDPRPKVRKRAVDLISDVLSKPPSPLSRHPYAQRVAEWLHTSLQQASTGVLSKSKLDGRSSDSADVAIHLLALLRPAIPPIISVLLALPRLGNPYLSQSSYAILSDLLSTSLDSGTQSSAEQIPAVLTAILASRPLKSDITVAPSWIRVLGRTMLTYRSADAEGCAVNFLGAWKAVWAFVESTQTQIRKAAAESLGSLAQCITLPMAQAAVNEPDDGRSDLRTVITQTSQALDSLAYAQAIPELLTVISSLTTSLALRIEPRKPTTAAEILLLPLVEKVADLRVQKNFEHKEAADTVISIAMRVVGPAVLLNVLPLNLEPQDRQAGSEPRAFLLPMISQPHPSPLSHFLSYFVPLSERMYNLQKKAEEGGRQAEAKVWSVLVSQVWTGFAGYCHASPDVKSALTPGFSQILSQILYNQPDLRLLVLRGLKVLVESNLVVSEDHVNEPSKYSALTGPITREEAAENIAFLKSQVESWFAVLFNVFSSVASDTRGVVGDVISVWANIAEPQEVSKAYGKVAELFKQNLQKLVRASDVQQSAAATTMIQDLFLLLLPFLDTSDITSLFRVCLTEEVLACRDNGVQKRGYKLLGKSVASGKLQVDVLGTLRQLDSFMVGLSPAAKRDRFVLLSLLVPGIPASSMHVITSLVPEAVLGTKEPSERTRSAAFDLVVAMGKRMSEGGVVKRQMLDEMDEGGATEAQASINEYITMVAAGLAGASPHMISASVTAISRLVYEFKDIIDSDVQTNIFTTLLVFLSSANREIVKSTLGYIKLAIHTLSVDLLRPYLTELVPALLAWSHDHKNHFKAKVRHIFERMIRRFSWDDVYSAAGKEEAAKVLVNIKKRKERAKRKKARAQDEDGGEEAPSVKVVTGDAFEDVLYGSESEYEDTDDESQVDRPTVAKTKNQHGVRLRADGDEPMDLLKGVASRVANAPGNRRRKPGTDAKRFNVDSDSGKIVIPAEESDSDIEVSARKAADIAAGGAYKESITSADGFTRDAKGRVKFNKDTRKRRRENADEDGDVEMADDTVENSSKRNKRRSEVKLGHEFKAKKAGGDVKKGKLEPYAYLPLRQAAKKKGRDRIGVSGKR